MVKIGEYNKLKVFREKSMGVFLDDGADGILLPKRYVPEGTKVDDELEVFIYHDSEDRVIATTQRPLGVLGDIVLLKVVSVMNHGAFLDWGLMKDLFIPKSKMRNYMSVGGEYLVKIIMDEKTGRLIATEKLEPYLSNEELTVSDKEEVNLTVYRETNIGFEVIINNRHKGILHRNQIYRPIEIGDKFKGYIKEILPENKINVVAGKMGYERVESETEKILRLLHEHDGYLPYHDKSTPDEIYNFFGMSKKTFKMALGKLYKLRQIELTKSGFVQANP